VKVAVILLTKDQREKTLRCLASLQFAGLTPHRVVVWDNGSSDGTSEAVQGRFPQVLFHRHPHNLGVASGRNAAAQLAFCQYDPEYLLFLDNDMIVTAGFLDALVDAIESDEKHAQAQAKIRFHDEPQRINDAGGCRINFWLGRANPVGFLQIDQGQYNRPARCIASGGATLFRTRVFRELGGFDPVFDPYGPEDLDFSLRAARRGYSALYVPQALVYHDRSQTFEGGVYTERYAETKALLWRRFLHRHGRWRHRAAFLVVGAPFLMLGILAREGRKGNWQGVKGAFRGLFRLRRAAVRET
jgi:GT2 family glycosyltransferase